jgi:hypothetical protein
VKVYIVLDKYDFSFSGVYSTREKAEEYIQVRDAEMSRLMGGVDIATANLVIEETELDLPAEGDWDEETLRQLEELPDDKPSLP